MRRNPALAGRSNEVLKFCESSEQNESMEFMLTRAEGFDLTPRSLREHPPCKTRGERTPHFFQILQAKIDKMNFSTSLKIWNII